LADAENQKKSAKKYDFSHWRREAGGQVHFFAGGRGFVAGASERPRRKNRLMFRL